MLNQEKHKEIFLQILKDIYADTMLGPALGFKGGTAAFLFYNLPRFSVDLDFDLLDISKEDMVRKKVKDIIQKYGIVKEDSIKHNTIFFLLSYSEKDHNIKVEISRRSLPALFEVKSFLGVPMLVIEREDMFANKLLAMTTRNKPANRDLFDVWHFFVANWSMNEKLVEERTGVDIKEYLRVCIVHVKHVEEKNILHGLGELINEKQKTWVRNNLKKELISRLEIRLESLL